MSDCGHELVRRKSRFGTTFIGCSNYPKCRYIKKEPKKEKAEGDDKAAPKKKAAAKNDQEGCEKGSEEIRERRLWKQRQKAVNHDG